MVVGFLTKKDFVTFNSSECNEWHAMVKCATLWGSSWVPEKDEIILSGVNSK